ncbi:MAG: thioredoxin family protein [Candidatus Shikimatogenerans sp. JK-2022]|nr:thioredoxin family protein [Candidatus Shikimatogenerans bostrichidophilus]
MKNNKYKLIIKNLKNNKFSILYFNANWCNPCIIMKHLINKIIKLYKNKIYIKKINIEKYKNLSKKFNINSIPTIIFLKNYKEINRNIGILNINKLINLCNNLINL